MTVKRNLEIRKEDGPIICELKEFLSEFSDEISDSYFDQKGNLHGQIEEVLEESCYTARDGTTFKAQFEHGLPVGKVSRTVRPVSFLNIPDERQTEHYDEAGRVVKETHRDFIPFKKWAMALYAVAIISALPVACLCTKSASKKTSEPKLIQEVKNPQIPLSGGIRIRQ